MHTIPMPLPARSATLRADTSTVCHYMPEPGGSGPARARGIRRGIHPSVEEIVSINPSRYLLMNVERGSEYVCSGPGLSSDVNPDASGCTRCEQTAVPPSSVRSTQKAKAMCEGLACPSRHSLAARVCPVPVGCRVSGRARRAAVGTGSGVGCTDYRTQRLSSLLPILALADTIIILISNVVCALVRTRPQTISIVTRPASHVNMSVISHTPFAFRKTLNTKD